LAVALEDGGFVNAAADPESEDGGEDAGEKDGAPSEARKDKGGDGGSKRVADGPEALYEGEGFAAGGRWEGFRDEGGTGRPLAAHA